jgi:hypothetical protein
VLLSEQFVNDAMQYYRAQWPVDAAEPAWFTPVEKNNVINYTYPYALPDGSVIAQKMTYKKIPAFYRIYPGNREEKIAVRSISLDDQFSYNNGKIIYTAYQPDPRWGYREFSTIRLLDVNTGEERTVAGHAQYFSPDISHDGTKIVAVQMDLLAESRLVVMDTNGQVQDSVIKPGLLFSSPKFAADDRQFYTAARNKAGEMALLKFGKQEETLLPFMNRLIGFLTVQGDTVLFSQSHEGRDEIWAIIDGKERKGPFLLASYSTGLYQGGLLPGDRLLRRLLPLMATGWPPSRPNGSGRLARMSWSRCMRWRLSQSRSPVTQ